MDGRVEEMIQELTANGEKPAGRMGERSKVKKNVNTFLNSSCKFFVFILYY
jgi:hypothetical protein